MRSAIQEALRSVEAKFLEVVRSTWLVKPPARPAAPACSWASWRTGRCTWRRWGTRKAVLGRKRGLLRGGITAIELSVEHNANNPWRGRR